MYIFCSATSLLCGTLVHFKASFLWVSKKILFSYLQDRLSNRLDENQKKKQYRLIFLDFSVPCPEKFTSWFLLWECDWFRRNLSVFIWKFLEMACQILCLLYIWGTFLIEFFAVLEVLWRQMLVTVFYLFLSYV